MQTTFDIGSISALDVSLAMRPVMLTLAAMLCGAPATIVAIVLLPWSVLVGIYGMVEQPCLASANLLLAATSVFALGNYWLLAARTVKRLPFKLGWSFRAACIAALLSIGAVFDSLPPLATLVVVAPILAATVWCLFEQQAISHKQNDA